MDFYSAVLFIHIAFSIVWLGSGFLLQILAFQYDRASEDVALEQLAASAARLANTLFMPSALVVLLAGVVLTVDGPWSFGSLWIILALVGFAITFLIGMLWIGPQTERIKALAERDGGMSTEARTVTRRMLTVARIDTVVLFLVVFDMAVKPAGGDVGVLVFMAAVLVLSSAYFIWRGRGVTVELETEPGPTAPA